MGKKSKVSPKPSQVIGTNPKNILSIETSCDDTSVAIVDGQGQVVALESENQDTVHSPYGGVIPELACRNHVMRLVPMVERVLAKKLLSWQNIDGVSVTNRPGLLGSLLMGVTVAKTLALIHNKPLIGVNHIEGHLYAPFLDDSNKDIESFLNTPFIGLCVSGGHTSLIHVKKFGSYKILGRTLDDAAGEAFDKFGKVLGLGYPAGKWVDQHSTNGNKDAYMFPRPMMKEFNFSFSGLKTAGKLKAEKVMAQNNGSLTENEISDLCASFQEAICDVLIQKLTLGLKNSKAKLAVISGGVACNSRLRQRAQEWALKMGVPVRMPPPKYCTDNAAMIGLVGLMQFRKGHRDNLKLAPRASARSSEII